MPANSNLGLGLDGVFRFPDEGMQMLVLKVVYHFTLDLVSGRV